MLFCICVFYASKIVKNLLPTINIRFVAVLLLYDFVYCAEYCIFVRYKRNIFAMQREITLCYEHYAAIDDMSGDDRELVEAALKACQRANAPYSNFHVGAAARLTSGRIISAANSESEVFPSGMCAERSLLYFYQSNYDDEPIEALAIASDTSDGECYPCGGCRQTLLDVERRQGSPMRIIMSGGGSASVVGSAADLMPFSFTLK